MHIMNRDPTRESLALKVEDYLVELWIVTSKLEILLLHIISCNHVPHSLAPKPYLGWDLTKNASDFLTLLLTYFIKA
jgi:hypothetical protein